MSSLVRLLSTLDPEIPLDNAILLDISALKVRALVVPIAFDDELHAYVTTTNGNALIVPTGPTLHFFLRDVDPRDPRTEWGFLIQYTDDPVKSEAPDPA